MSFSSQKKLLFSILTNDGCYRVGLWRKPVKKSLFIIFGKEYVKAIASINYFNIIAPVEYSYTQGRETHSHLDVFPSV